MIFVWLDQLSGRFVTAIQGKNDECKSLDSNLSLNFLVELGQKKINGKKCRVKNLSRFSGEAQQSQTILYLSLLFL